MDLVKVSQVSGNEVERRHAAIFAERIDSGNPLPLRSRNPFAPLAFIL